MSLHADVIWEFRPTAGDNANGGGFKAGASGVDLSIQDAAEQAYTDLVIDAVDNTKITSAAERAFIADDVGNIINITGGTGFTTGRFEITAVAAGVATVDRAIGTTGSTGGTGNLGGALDVPYDAWVDNDLRSDGTNVHRVYIKNTGTGTIAADLTFTNKQGATTRQLLFEGYNTTRGDNPTGTNRPLLDFGAFSLQLADTNSLGWLVKNLRFTTTSATGIAIPGLSVVRNCKFSNTSGTAGRIAVSSGYSTSVAASASVFIDCEMNSTAGTAFSIGSQSYVSADVHLIGCFIHDSVTGVGKTGTNSTILFIEDCIIKACSTAGLTGTTQFRIIKNCTFYGAATPAGIAINNSGQPSGYRWLNNIIYGWTTGISVTTPDKRGLAEFNNFFNNTTNRSNIDAGPNDIALDPQFTDPSTNDFTPGANMQGVGTPNVNIGAGGSATRSYVDLGAAQTQAADYPSEDDVRDGVSFGDGAFEGNMTLPAEADVEAGVQYGTNGTEFEGTLPATTGGQRTRGILPFYAVKGS
ncbi:MAG: hypothetical protein MOGMAGMI_01967 [Candidatus Omnitrophica bacterium]|nr:hypothetical protein [Candidatus Omnitrophota bacterium]